MPSTIEGAWGVGRGAWELRNSPVSRLPPPAPLQIAMELMVNGVKQALSDSLTVTQLLDILKIVPERVVVELNLTILKRAEHANTTLKEGDQVEIVHFVGGGS